MIFEGGVWRHENRSPQIVNMSTSGRTFTNSSNDLWPGCEPAFAFDKATPQPSPSCPLASPGNSAERPVERHFVILAQRGTPETTPRPFSRPLRGSERHLSSAHSPRRSNRKSGKARPAPLKATRIAKVARSPRTSDCTVQGASDRNPRLTSDPWMADL